MAEDTNTSDEKRVRLEESIADVLEGSASEDFSTSRPRTMPRGISRVRRSSSRRPRPAGGGGLSRRRRGARAARTRRSGRAGRRGAASRGGRRARWPRCPDVGPIGIGGSGRIPTKTRLASRRRQSRPRATPCRSSKPTNRNPARAAVSAIGWGRVAVSRRRSADSRPPQPLRGLRSIPPVRSRGRPRHGKGRWPRFRARSTGPGSSGAARTVICAGPSSEGSAIAGSLVRTDEGTRAMLESAKMGRRWSWIARRRSCSTRTKRAERD